MCSILIFKRQNPAAGTKQAWKYFDYGDVVDVNEADDFFWGNDIQGPKALGWWRVVVLPGVPAADVLALTEPELPSAPDLVDPPLKRRFVKVDLAAIEAAEEARKGSRLDVRDKAVQTKVDLLAKVVAKPTTASDGSDAVKVTKG